METKAEIKIKGISISKSKGYGAEHKINLGLDKDRNTKFNKGEKITVTKKELELIGKHRWLEVDNG